MKKNLLFLLIVCWSFASGQVPNQINYQGIARNSVGNVLPNKNISVRLSIHDGSSVGSIVYKELRNIKTSNFGLFSIAIGSPGAVSVTGTIGSINWGSGAKFLQVEIDPAGGANFIDLGAAQLLSVPYALFSGNASTATGVAGGDLIGNYPDPNIATGAVTTTKLADGSVTSQKLAAGVIPTSLPPNGSAGGDLAGSYPNPTVNKLLGIGLKNTVPTLGQVLKFNGTQWAPATDSVGSGGGTSGPAGGDLSGTYPNPIIANNAITTIKILNGSITAAKLAAGVIPTSLPPNGAAGGDLTGTYPNPTIGTNAITTAKILNGSVTAAKLAAGVIPTSLPPNGTAGGDLSGTYPNPTIGINAITTTKISDGSVTAVKLAAGVIPTSLPPNGAAGGDLSGTYPNPTIGINAITTTKILDGAVTAAKVAAGVIPTSLPPNGAAGGDLSGIYPNPTVNQIQGVSVNSTAPAIGQVLKFDGTQWSPGTDNGGSGGNPTGPAGGDLSGNYPNPNIASGAITTPKIANGSIVTPKIVDGAVTAAKLAAGVIPTSLPPSGAAGGDLAGSYPNPSVNALVGISLNTTPPTAGQVLKFNGTQWAPGIDNSGGGGAPSGPAGGDLSGTYPNPTIGVNVITTTKILDGSVTSAKLAAGVIPTSLPPNGAAGGDLSGTYPNPTVGTNAITTTKILDGSVTSSKLAAGVIPTTLPPNGAAGGDLAGSFPNPSVNALVGISINTTPPTTGQVLKFNGTQWAPGVDNSGGGGAPSGPAGGDLSGTYPNPTVGVNAITTTKILDGSVTSAKLAAGVIPTSLPPNGTAGGDLSGTYPNPTIGPNAITTTKILDGSVTLAKLAAGVIPTSLPPNGTAGGDLSGTYPNPGVNKIQGTAVNNTAPTSGQVLKFNGTQWAPGTDNSSAFSLPYSNTLSSAQNLISVTNSGTGAGIEGINSSTNANAFGVIGQLTSASPGTNSSAVRGVMTSAASPNGIGVWGSHNGFGIGVYGSSVNNNGVQGFSANSNGVFGSSDNNASGYFDISNTSNSSDALVANTVGTGNGVYGSSDQGNGVWGITFNAFAAGIFGLNAAGGEAITGMNNGAATAAVAGTNSGNNGIGVSASANSGGATGGTALVATLESAGGNLALFQVGINHKARIDDNGKGYFNGGTQNSGADLAEAFDISGNRKDYEAGDVLVISQNSDRQVEKSSSAYSTLVAGVYATKPGVLLTEKNAEQDQLDAMVPMGIVGVIPTKVCLEGGIIKRGDLLVTSSTPGVAMKADPDKVKVGQVIGKALQEYDQQCIGKINVLVSIK